MIKNSIPKVVVLGGHAAALQFYLDRFPMPGDYLVAKKFREALDGGKAVNQAIAISRLGANTICITAVGRDPHGNTALTYMENEGIDLSHLLISDSPTGLGCGFIIDDGTPMGASMLGACEELTPEYVRAHSEAFTGADILMLSLEIPVETMLEGIRIGRDKKIPMILLNPSPADSIVGREIPYVDIFTPNETEALLLCGMDSFSAELLPQMAGIMRNNYHFGILAITLGSQGCFIDYDGKQELLPCQKVKTIDTSGAGDSFNSAFVFGLYKGMDVHEAACFAMRCATYSVTQYDSWPAYPTIELAESL